MTDPFFPCVVCGSRMSPFIERIWDDRYGCPGEFAIVKCSACGQMMTVPPLAEAELPGLYSTYYPRRSIDFAALEAEATLVLRPLARLRRWLNGTDNQGHYLARPGQEVLDIGCGSCLSLLEMRHLGVDAYGVEADPNVASIAEKYGLNVHIGSIHDDPFPRRFFNLITLNQVIEHVPDPGALLRVVRERLLPDGRVVLAFPNGGSLARRLSGLRWINWHVPYHQHHFNRRSFARLAGREGYVVESMRTITPNLWTMLQITMMRGTPREGVMSSVWTAASADGPTARPGLLRRMRGKGGRTVLWLARVLSMAVNRVVDAVGAGDSLLVVLSRDDRVGRLESDS